MFLTQKTFSYWSLFYFILLVFLGAYFIVNVTLAVIKLKFTYVNDNKEKEEEELLEEDELVLLTC